MTENQRKKYIALYKRVIILQEGDIQDILEYIAFQREFRKDIPTFKQMDFLITKEGK